MAPKLNHTIFLNVLIFCMFAGLCERRTKREDCQCWEDFEAELENGIVFCRGKKHHRIFGCNEEKPPICQCLVNGDVVELDLGETNCLDVDMRNGRWCYNRAEFEEYFRKHPQRAIYN